MLLKTEKDVNAFCRDEIFAVREGSITEKS
jgi:hypothetical protein